MSERNREVLLDLGLGSPGKLTEVILRHGQGYEIGAGQHVDPTKIVAIAAETVAVAYDTLHSSMNSDGTTGTAHYQVPSGKTLFIIRITYTVSATTLVGMLGYGDDAVSSSITPPTNAVGLTPRNLKGAAGNLNYAVDVLLKVPAGKYPYVRASDGGTLSVLVFGIER